MTSYEAAIQQDKLFKKNKKQNNNNKRERSNIWLETINNTLVGSNSLDFFSLLHEQIFIYMS